MEYSTIQIQGVNYVNYYIDCVIVPTVKSCNFVNISKKTPVMETRDLIMNAEVMENRSGREKTNLPGSSLELSGSSEAISKILGEGGASFYNYVKQTGLIKDPDLLVLSSVHHYYFDNEDLNGINTLVNIKQLNLIKNIDSFLQSIFKLISKRGNFIACFLNNKTQYEFAISNILLQYHVKNNIDPFENGITSRIPFLNSLYNLLDSKTDRYMTGGIVNLLFKKQGFEILDMTELNGLTYIHSQKFTDFTN